MVQYQSYTLGVFSNPWWNPDLYPTQTYPFLFLINDFGFLFIYLSFLLSTLLPTVPPSSYTKQFWTPLRSLTYRICTKGGGETRGRLHEVTGWGDLHRGDRSENPLTLPTFRHLYPRPSPSPSMWHVGGLIYVSITTDTYPPYGGYWSEVLLKPLSYNYKGIRKN